MDDGAIVGAAREAIRRVEGGDRGGALGIGDRVGSGEDVVAVGPLGGAGGLVGGAGDARDAAAIAGREAGIAGQALDEGVGYTTSRWVNP